MKISLFSVWLFLVLFLLSSESYSFKKSPYILFEGDNTKMTVMWQTESVQSCSIKWGTDTSCNAGSGQSTALPDSQHKYSITGLTPGVKYYYKVITPSTVAGYSSSFRTAPASTAKKVKFYAYGDSRTNQQIHDSINKLMINLFTTDPEFQTIALHSGDMAAYDLEANWTSEYFTESYKNTRSFRSQLSVVTTLGNHEAFYYTKGAVLKKYMPYPYVNSFYWSFDYGPAHIVIFDQFNAPFTSGSQQYNWLVNDLKNSNKKWKFIVIHTPAYGAGGGHSNDAAFQSTIQPLLVQYGVDIVFNGDNHYYSRIRAGTIKHITTGGGGAPLYSPVVSTTNLEASASQYHYCEVIIDGANLDVIARGFGNKIIDKFTLTDATISNSNEEIINRVNYCTIFAVKGVIHADGIKTKSLRYVVTDCCGKTVNSGILSGLNGLGSIIITLPQNVPKLVFVTLHTDNKIYTKRVMLVK